MSFRHRFRFRRKFGQGGGSSGGSSSAPQAGHPRLMMTSSGASPTVAELQARMASTGAQGTKFQAFVDLFCKSPANGGYFDYTTFKDVLEDTDGCYIYSYLLATWQVSGIDYRDATQASIRSLLDQFLGAEITLQVGNEGVREMTALGLAYDWTVGTGDISSTRSTGIIAALKLSDDPFGGGSYQPLAHTAGRSAQAYHWLGYVWDGDGIDDSSATTRIALRDSHVTGATGVRAMLNHVAGSAGGYCEGHGYFMSENKQGVGHMDFIYHESYRTVTGASSVWATGVNAIWEYMPHWMAYFMAPFKSIDSLSGLGYVLLKSPQSEDRISGPLPDGNVDASQQTWALIRNIARVYQTTNPETAGLARWIEQTMYESSGFSMSNYAQAGKWGVIGEFLGYSTTAAISPAAAGLPLAKWFNPWGTVIIRDNWDFDGTGSWFKFVAPPYKWARTGYDQETVGGFAIHRRGPIIVEPGSGAHNPSQEAGWGGSVMVFPNTTETSSGIGQTSPYEWDMGGARPAVKFSVIPNDTGDFTPGSQLDMGGLKAGTGRVDLSDGSSAHQYSAIYADLTRAYNSTAVDDGFNSVKIRNWERQIVRFQPPNDAVDPGFTVIFDRTQTLSTAIEPRWQLYPAGHPTGPNKTMTIAGHDSTTTVTRDGNVGLAWLATGGNVTGTIAYSSIRGVSAKGFWSPLLPASCKIIERGGPDSSNAYGSSRSHEWEDPYGKQGGFWVAPEPSYGGNAASALYEANYKYELLAQVTSTVSVFANVIEDVEPAAAAKTPASVSTRGPAVAIQIDSTAGNRKVTVFKDSTGTMSTGRFLVGSTGTYDILISDVPADTAITFAKGANLGELRHIATGDTDLTYTTSSNLNVWLRLVVTTAGSTTANVVSW